MATNTQDAGNQMGAGLYVRVRKQIRSWSWRWSQGWNTKKLTEVSEREIGSPWAGVAEWLRTAHSLLDEQTVEMTRSSDRSR
ncbi:MAG TPA: hypothetical protein VGK21_04190 [Candidatus Angelobacter sp.]|jgi:hypothetical protein